MGAARLEVEIIGAGRDLVLLHSLLSDRSSFEPLVARLAGERRLVLVSLPGFGQSPRAGIGDYADAVAAAFEDPGLPPETDVMGNGLGGFVTLMLASRPWQLVRAHGPGRQRDRLSGSGAGDVSGARRQGRGGRHDGSRRCRLKRRFVTLQSKST